MLLNLSPMCMVITQKEERTPPLFVFMKTVTGCSQEVTGVSGGPILLSINTKFFSKKVSMKLSNPKRREDFCEVLPSLAQKIRSK